MAEPSVARANASVITVVMRSANAGSRVRSSNWSKRLRRRILAISATEVWRLFSVLSTPTGIRRSRCAGLELRGWPAYAQPSLHGCRSAC